MGDEQEKQEKDEQNKPKRGHDVIQPDNGFIDINDIFNRKPKAENGNG